VGVVIFIEVVEDAYKLQSERAFIRSGNASTPDVSITLPPENVCLKASFRSRLRAMRSLFSMSIAASYIRPTKMSTETIVLPPQFSQ
jgi:hypothetical protein